jgi:K+-sensing histidine kinase KdpD
MARKNEVNRLKNSFFMIKKRTILIVENQKDRLERLEKTLQKSNFQIIVAREGKTAKQLAWENSPDLIILAMKLPDLDSYQVIAELREQFTTSTTPIVILSNQTNTLEWRRAIEAGADDYLGNPFTVAQLGRAIAVQLEKKLAQEAKIQLELEQLRRNVTCSLPHELKTALTGILSSSALLYTDLEHLDILTVRKLADYIQLSGQRLSRLIQNSLLYTELELISSSPQELQKVRHSYINSIVGILENIAIQKAKQVDREADIKLELQNASVQIEPYHFLKLVEEIFDNALKFSEPGTTVWIHTKKTRNHLLLSIGDRGRGMTKQQIERIGAYMQFDRQYYEQQGTGLGLAIAKRLIDLYKGQLAIESIPERETIVRVYLPIAERFFSLDTKESWQFEVV